MAMKRARTQADKTSGRKKPRLKDVDSVRPSVNAVESSKLIEDEQLKKESCKVIHFPVCIIYIPGVWNQILTDSK